MEECILKVKKKRKLFHQYWPNFGFLNLPSAVKTLKTTDLEEQSPSTGVRAIGSSESLVSDHVCVLKCV